jgi:hypothetical protein
VAVVGGCDDGWWVRLRCEAVVVMGTGKVVVGGRKLYLYLVTSCVCIWLFEVCLCLVFVFGYEFRLRPVRLVFCRSSRSSNFRNRERLKTGPRLRSSTVLGISGLGQSWSSPVSVFFQSWDWTSKH